MSDDRQQTDVQGQALDDDRSDIEQVVDARKDAVERGEGGQEPDAFTAPGDYAGTGGTGGVVKNQDDDAQ